MSPLIHTGAEPAPRDLLISPAPPSGYRAGRASLSFTESLLLLPPIHAVAYALRWVDLRDRLRCPECRAVGTWKPHGTLTARWRDHDRPVRRWMCKWCGHYIGPEGRLQCFPDPERGYWAMPRPWDPDSPEKPGLTPKEAVAEKLGKVWPWRG